MCGICGIIDSNSLRPILDQTVAKMNQAIFHRGPDEAGLFGDEHCSLAMRRLSIIDLHSGKQPLYNEDKSILVFLNGEIYNYQELRSELEDKGHKFYTQSDTEVLPHLYEEYQEEMVLKLKGMFTFCIYLLKEQKWFLARDRFGEKPLYYHQSEGQLSFSSEVKSLLENERIPRHLNKNALTYYLSNTFVPEPETLLNKVYSLPPGHQMSFSKGKLTIKKYFKPDYNVDPNLKTEGDCISFLEPILKQAVKRQMVSDVPIGAFLSGGIDSSTVVANMQALSDKPIKTFTARFEEAKYDESPIAREVAQLLGTEHHELTIPNYTFTEDIFWKIINHVGLPFPDSSAIPSFFITEEIRKHVTVALSGDGGDELFAGYPVYTWWKKIEQLYAFPKGMRNLGNTLLQKSSTLQRKPLGRQLLRALSAASGPKEEIGARINILFDDTEIAYLTKGLKPSFDKFALFPNGSNNWSTIQKALYFRLTHNLPLDMLIKVDRMSMANSLEVRAPFLDPDLFDASTKIPEQFLIKDGKGKYIIRQLMKKQLPDSVFNHPKSGFSIPLHSYMNSTFQRLCEDLILNNEVMQELFDPEALSFFVERGLSQKTDEALTVYRVSHQVWSLLQLGGWIKAFKISNTYEKEEANSVRGFV